MYRLESLLHKYYRTIAVDFDGTLCEFDYPNIGKIAPKHQTVIDFIKINKSRGSTIILWTCRCGKPLEEAVAWCKEKEIPIDYVNENPPELIKAFGGDTRKVVAELYIDDKGINPFI